MARQVIIVESPNKAKTLRQLVGRDFEVVATVGHFCDLPVKELGVDVANGFKPTYVYDPDKKDVVARLKELGGRYPAGEILVASDADREGEAIGWHIARTIGLEPDQVRRVEFHEITETGVRRALQSIRPLDLGLVAAQEARRILDRLVGYTVSPVVRDRLPDERDISAGRVQSVALRVVVDRELAIRAFQPCEYWSVHARYAWPGAAERSWEAEVVGIGTAAKFKAVPLDDGILAWALAEQLNGIPHQVTKIVRKESQRKPPAPFITSTMLQNASTRLKMSTDEATRHAKVLFEKGLVTYIRTDEPSVSPEFQQETLAYLRSRFGAAVVPAKPNVHKAKGNANAQGAHECIRPTDLSVEEPAGPEPRALALFRLIRETYLASQCKPARYDVTEAFLQAGDHVLKASGRVLKEAGFLTILKDDDETEQGDDAQAKPLPALTEGEQHRPQDVVPSQHWTKPPERFTEATLIKYLEERGIGRPSTFNAMVSKILGREFVERVNKRFLQPTPKGERLDAELRACFAPVIDEGFTAELETHLDAIAARQEEWRAFLGKFWQALTPLVDAARQGTSARPLGGASREGTRGPGSRTPDAEPDDAAPQCPKCKESFTRRIHSAKTGKDYYVCGRDSRERQVCGYIVAIEDPAELSGNPPCYRCQAPMKLVASRKAFRCSVDACNTWLDQDYGRHPPCPVCGAPTRAFESKGYGCVKWRKEGREESCPGFVKWAAWTPPPAAARRNASSPKGSPSKPDAPKRRSKRPRAS